MTSWLPGVITESARRAMRETTTTTNDTIHPPLHHVWTPSAAPPAHPIPIPHPPTRLRLPAMSRRRSNRPSTRPKWAWRGRIDEPLARIHHSVTQHPPQQHNNRWQLPFERSVITTGRDGEIYNSIIYGGAAKHKQTHVIAKLCCGCDGSGSL